MNMKTNIIKTFFRKELGLELSRDRVFHTEQQNGEHVRSLQIDLDMTKCENMRHIGYAETRLIRL